MVAAVRDLHGEVGELSAAGAFPSHVLEEEEKTSCRVKAAWRGGVSELPMARLCLLVGTQRKEVSPWARSTLVHSLQLYR